MNVEATVLRTLSDEYVLVCPSFVRLAGFGCSCLSDMRSVCLFDTHVVHSHTSHVCHSRTSKVGQSAEKLDNYKNIFI